MKKINYAIIKPSGNVTAVVYTACKRDDYCLINAEILKREKDCEQVVFIKKFNKRFALVEMAGGEFCGNAVRAVMFYFFLNKNLSNMEIKYVGYPFKMYAYSNGLIASVQICIDDLVKEITPIDVGLTKVVMVGITHYIVEPNSKLFRYVNDRNKTQKLIEKFITNEKCIGIVYVKNNEMTPYVFIKKVNTLFLETACGSGMIACALKYRHLNKNIKIKQPSQYYLQVDFDKNNANLIGECEFMKKDYILYGGND